MRTFTTPLGDTEVTVVAPEPANFDPEAFCEAFPRGATYGIDVEGTYMGDLAQWDPDFEIRLIQFATEAYAWVLDLADPEQEKAAVGLLADETTWLCSHTPMDVLAVFARLGVDITLRNADTRVYAKMADPDSLGGLDLKSLSVLHGMPQLAEYDQKLDKRFLELWLAAGGKRGAARDDVARYGWSAISETDETYLVYAGLDAIACRRLLPILTAASGAPRELLEIETWLAGQANRIQIRGMLVDQAKLDQISGSAQEVADRTRALVAERTGEIGRAHV